MFQKEDNFFKVKPFDHQLEVFNDIKDRPYYGLFWEMGCVTGNTQIPIAFNAYSYTPQTIKYLADQKKSFYVLSKNEKGFTVSLAKRAFKKPKRQEMFKVTFDDTSSIQCTENHVFLTEQGWYPLSDFHAGDDVLSCQASCEPDRFYSIRESFLLTLDANVKNFLQRPQDFQESCFVCYDLCDERLRLEIANALASFLQLDGVLEHIHVYLNVDVLDYKLKHIQTYLKSFPLSMQDSYSHTDFSRKEFDILLNALVLFLKKQNNVLQSWLHSSPALENFVALVSVLISSFSLKSPFKEYLYPSHNNIINKKIKEIKTIGYKDVYDMTVHQTENYISHDGAINHNTGKTFELIHVIRYKLNVETDLNPVLVVCPKAVTHNWAKEFKMFSPNPEIEKIITVLEGTKQQRIVQLRNPDKKIFIINYEGIGRIKDIQIQMLKMRWGAIVLDEAQRCLHYDSYIKTNKGVLKIGDIVNNNIDCKVLSFNSVNNVLEYKKVKQRFKNKRTLRVLEISCGKRKIRCTENHKIYCNGEWKEAVHIRNGDYLSLLWKKEVSIKIPQWKVLFDNLFNKGKSKTIVRIHEEKQPNVQSRNKKKSIRVIQGKTIQGHKGWKWEANETAENCCKANRSSYGICNSNSKETRQWIPVMLQGRSCNTKEIYSNRDRWSWSQIWKEKRARREERTITKAVRVDSVKVLELGSRSGTRQGNKENYFYDIEVEDNHNYFANGILVHNCKNHKAAQTKAILKIAANAKYRYIATGTPILNTMMDIFTLYLFLDGGKMFGQNFYQFQNRYFIDKHASWKGSPKYFPNWQPRKDKEQEVQKLIYSCADRKLKEHCLDLPPKVYEKYYVEMDKEQTRMYAELQKELITFFKNETIVASTALTKILRLNQITSGFISVEGAEGDKAIRNISDSKIKALEELVSDIVPSKVIIWAFFRNDIKRIGEALAKYNSVTIYGGTSDDQRKHAIESFQGDDKCKVFIGQQRACGLGITLTRASYAIYYSQGYSLEDRLQSEDRCHRAGSEEHNKITYIDLVCKDTVDEVILEALRNKEDFATNILDKVQLLLGGVSA